MNLYLQSQALFITLRYVPNLRSPMLQWQITSAITIFRNTCISETMTFLFLTSQWYKQLLSLTRDGLHVQLIILSTRYVYHLPSIILATYTDRYLFLFASRQHLTDVLCSSWPFSVHIFPLSSFRLWALASQQHWPPSPIGKPHSPTMALMVSLVPLSSR